MSHHCVQHKHGLPCDNLSPDGERDRGELKNQNRGELGDTDKAGDRMEGGDDIVKMKRYEGGNDKEGEVGDRTDEIEKEDGDEGRDKVKGKDEYED